jgi:hypothetical protein
MVSKPHLEGPAVSSKLSLIDNRALIEPCD